MSSPAHIVQGPPPLLPSRSHHPWPTAVALTLVVNGPLLSSPLRSHHPRPNQRCCRLTPLMVPCLCLNCGHITPSPLPLCSRHSWPPAVVVVVVTSPTAHRHRTHIVHGLLLLPLRSHNPRPTAVALMFAGALSSSVAYWGCAEVAPGPAAIALT